MRDDKDTVLAAPSRSRVNWRLVWQILVPLICLAVFGRMVDWRQFLAVLASVRLSYLLLALFLFGITPLIFLVRWRSILNRLGIHYSLPALLPIFATGYAFQFFLPTGLGDGVKILYLVEDNYPAAKSTVSIVIDKLSSYLAALILGIWGFSLIRVDGLADWNGIRSFSWEIAVVSAGIGLVLLALLVLFPRSRPTVRRWLQPGLTRLLSYGPINRFRRIMAGAGNDFRMIQVHNYLWFLLLSLVGDLVEASVYYLIALAVGIDLTYLQVVAIGSILAMLLSIPIITFTIGGLGVRESIVAGIFLLLGLPIEQALVFSLLIFAISVLWRIFALGGWLIRPINIRRLVQRVRA